MQFPQVNTVPNGLGFELSPEEEAIREMIRAGWSEDEAATRKKGIPVDTMIHTFHTTAHRLVEKANQRRRNRRARNG